MNRCITAIALVFVMMLSRIIEDEFAAALLSRASRLRQVSELLAFSDHLFLIGEIGGNLQS
jgi:hypothetical protein